MNKTIARVAATAAAVAALALGTAATIAPGASASPLHTRTTQCGSPGPSDGSFSLVQLAAVVAASDGPSWTPAKFLQFQSTCHNGVWTDGMQTYINGGNLNAPIPAGVNIWLPSLIG